MVLSPLYTILWILYTAQEVKKCFDELVHLFAAPWCTVKIITLLQQHVT